MPNIAYIKFPHNSLVGSNFYSYVFTRQQLAAGWKVRGSNPGRGGRGGRNLPHSFRPTLGPAKPAVKRVLGLFPGSKEAEVSL